MCESPPCGSSKGNRDYGWPVGSFVFFSQTCFVSAWHVLDILHLQIVGLFPHVSYYIVLEQFPEKDAERFSSINTNEKKKVSFRTRSDDCWASSQPLLSFLPPPRNSPVPQHMDTYQELVFWVYYVALTAENLPSLRHSLPPKLSLTFSTIGNSSYGWKLPWCSPWVLKLFQIWNSYNQPQCKIYFTSIGLYLLWIVCFFFSWSLRFWLSRRKGKSS